MNKRKKWIVTAVILVVFCAVLGVYRHFGPGSSASVSYTHLTLPTKA